MVPKVIVIFNLSVTLREDCVGPQLKLCGNTDKCWFFKWQMLYITTEFILVLSVESVDQITF